MTVAVIGGTLAGMAAAARLAKAGHQVVLIDDDMTPQWPPCAPTDAIELPAAWRDLFTKTGRILDAALAVRGLELVPAPPVRVRLADHEVDWPTDRGEQHHVVVAAYGQSVAEQWRTLGDQLVTQWQQVRRLSLESPYRPHDRDTKALVTNRTTVADLAADLPPALGDLVRATATDIGSDPSRTPGWVATRLAVQRTFGRWQLIDTQGTTQPITTLVDVLRQRVSDRKVTWRPGRVQTITGTTDGLTVELGDGQENVAAAVSTVDLWRHAELTGRPVARVRQSVQLGPVRFGLPSHPLQPAIAGADPYPRFDGSATVAALPPLEDPTPRLWYAGSGSIAGPHPWQQLLVAALAVYEVHELLTGADIRPSNKATSQHRARTPRSQRTT